jgi:hypothetical protein
MKVSSRMAMPPKAPTTRKSVGAALSKVASGKAAPVKSVPRTSVTPGAGVPPKADAPLWTAVSKPTMMVTALKARVLRINTGQKG